MALNSVRTFRRRPVQPQRADQRLPHPSWRLAIPRSDADAGEVITAHDFWDRLGL